MSGNTFTPKVDVIITAFNEQASEIKRTIQSVLEQSVPVSTILLIDDASLIPVNISGINTGQTELKLIRNKENKGISFSRNLGINLSKATYIACVNVEVSLNPLWISKTLSILSANQEIGCVFTRITSFRNSIYTRWRFRFQEQKQPESSGTFFMATGHAVLFRRADLLHIGGYVPSLKRIGEDFRISQDLIKMGLSTYYIHESLAVSFQYDSLLSISHKQVIRLIGNNEKDFKGFPFFRIIFKDFSNRFVRNVLKFRFPFVIIDFLVFYTILKNYGLNNNDLKK